MSFVIAQPIEGISLNGLEYLLDENENVKVFKSYDEAHEFVSTHIDEVTPEEFILSTAECPSALNLNNTPS
jgi:hypothetical protein